MHGFIETDSMFKMYLVFISLIMIIGLYCVISTRNLLRILLGLEILTKAVTLLLIYSGYISKHTALAQAFVITLIIIEVVVIVIAGGVVLNVFKYNNSLDTRNLKNLKG